MQPGAIIHLYNHANGFENLFRDEDDYFLFTQRLIKFTSTVAHCHAYCLMPNHFHLVIRVREEQAITNTCYKGPIERQASKAFSNAFSSYAQIFNKKYGRMGALFIPSMKQRLVTSENDFCKVVHYVHSNPVHHGFTKTMGEWKYSSYAYLMNGRKGWLDTKYTIENFGSLDAFKKYHDQPIGLKSAIL